MYANGQAVATNRSASLYNNGRAYFGTDILGSVRSATDDYATLEDRYEYDIFGTPYEGDFTSGLNNGYTGKPYDSITGLYNYGYRDYSPQQARFTTVDPIRDGNNWFSYVVNDPVNYVDLWGLCKTSSDQKNKVVVFRALYASKDDSLNSRVYNKLVDSDFDEIKEAAEKNGLDFELITGQDATGKKFTDVLADESVERLVVVAHGSESGYIYGVGERIDRLNFGDTNIPTIDIVACYASNKEEKIIDLTNNDGTKTQINTYNPIEPNSITADKPYGDGKIIWWNQTNNVVKNIIPESMLSGNPDSGEAQTSFIDKVLGSVNKKMKNREDPMKKIIVLVVYICINIVTLCAYPSMDIGGMNANQVEKYLLNIEGLEIIERTQDRSLVCTQYTSFYNGDDGNPLYDTLNKNPKVRSIIDSIDYQIIHLVERDNFLYIFSPYLEGELGWDIVFVYSIDSGELLVQKIIKEYSTPFYWEDANLLVYRDRKNGIEVLRLYDLISLDFQQEILLPVSDLYAYIQYNSTIGFSNTKLIIMTRHSLLLYDVFSNEAQNFLNLEPIFINSKGDLSNLRKINENTIGFTVSKRSEYFICQYDLTKMVLKDIDENSLP